MRGEQQRQIPRCRRCGRISDAPEAFTLCAFCRRLPSELSRPPLVQINATPPCDILSESIVLGRLMLEPTLAEEYAMTPADFYAPLHRALFKVLLVLRPTNPLTVADSLSLHPVTLLRMMWEGLKQQDWEIEQRVQNLRETAQRRRRIEAARQTILAAHDCYLTMDDVDKRINHAFREARNA